LGIFFVLLPLLPGRHCSAAEFEAGGPIATRWTDLLPTNDGTDEEASPALFEALASRARLNNASAITQFSTSYVSLSKERYLMCLLGTDSAGVVTQLRHLVECSALAVKLNRTLLTTPMLISNPQQSGDKPSGWPRFWGELIDFPHLASLTAGLRWSDGGRVRLVPNLPNTTTCSVDIFTAEQSLPGWVRNFLCGFLLCPDVVSNRRYQTLADISGQWKRHQHTLVVVHVPDTASRRRDMVVAQLKPVAWLEQIESLVRTQLFGSPRPRTLAMTMVRGADLAKCLNRASLQPPEPPDDDEAIFDHLLMLMQHCFQDDNDIEAVVTTIRERFGHMEVYLVCDESSEESLEFFQTHGAPPSPSYFAISFGIHTPCNYATIAPLVGYHASFAGYKTRLDASVIRAHLRPMDGLFLDYLLCLRSTLFVGNSRSKTSKQVVGLRESIDLPSFILKAAARAH